LLGSSAFEIPLKAVPGGTMYNLKDPEEMTPEELMRELAQILAQGYLRFRKNTQDLGEGHSNVAAQDGATDNITKSFAMDKSAN
jgi:hypothetical protein